MEDAIKKLPTQFDFQPVVENESTLMPADSFVVCGMGGSHLAAGLLKIINPTFDIYIHRDYGLPQLSEKRFAKSLFIASSYSGNTEEVVDFAEKAFANKYNLAVIATGGKLIDLAKKNKLPFVLMPSDGIQPRSALGLSLLALTKLLDGDDLLHQIQSQGKKLNPEKFVKAGQEMANILNGKVPVIYSSRRNLGLAYNWKIKFNETAKIPAFYNTFSELNHNEMTGFDLIPSTTEISSRFYFIFLEDSEDSPKIMRRMEVLKKLYEDRGLPVISQEVAGPSTLEKVFNSLILADWTALSLSKIYGTEAEAVPMVEEFKKLIT